MLRAGRRARNVPVGIDVISSVTHGRGWVGAVPHAIDWTATERRSVKGERARRYMGGEGAKGAICRAELSQGRGSVHPRHVLLRR